LLRQFGLPGWPQILKQFRPEFQAGAINRFLQSCAEICRRPIAARSFDAWNRYHIFAAAGLKLRCLKVLPQLCRDRHDAAYMTVRPVSTYVDKVKNQGEQCCAEPA